MRNLLNKFLLSMSDLSIGIYSISAMVVLSNIRVGERWNRNTTVATCTSRTQCGLKIMSESQRHERNLILYGRIRGLLYFQIHTPRAYRTVEFTEIH